MNPDLDHLIRLQQLDVAAEDARRTIATAPERSAALDARIESARAALASAEERRAANEAARRALEKDIAAVRSRRSKYQDQTMEVKTNREFHALQKEIEVADEEIRRLEDGMLENMLAADEIAAEIKADQAALKETERAVAAERQALEAEGRQAAADLDSIGRQRAELAAELPQDMLAVFEKVARTKKGTALAEARDGLCSVCHVRLRPQVLNEVRRNDRIIQCESCQRILYYVPPPAPQAGASA
jgi:predicted  nucleic acid-binding Zn-ribbon protein